MKIFFDEEVELIPDDGVPEGEVWMFWRTRRDGQVVAEQRIAVISGLKVALDEWVDDYQPIPEE